jgi:hypothetical protein
VAQDAYAVHGAPFPSVETVFEGLAGGEHEAGQGCRAASVTAAQSSSVSAGSSSAISTRT